MGLIKEPFDQMVQTLGATHHWPMTGSDPANNEVLGGADISLAVTRTLTEEYGVLLTNRDTLYASSSGNNWALTVNGLPTHFTNAGLSEYTLLFFYKAESTPYAVMDFDNAGQVGSPAGGFNMYAFKVYSDGTYQRHHNDSSGSRSSATVDPTTDGVGEGIMNPYGGGEIIVGHILYFPSALSAEDLTTIYNQRQYLGRVAGTATVDGEGAPATVRGIGRSDDTLIAETTAAADGSYELWTTKQADLDVLALPPDGVAARPVAHGPITPIDQN